MDIAALAHVRHRLLRFLARTNTRDFLRYFAMVRLELHPLLTPPAEALLSTYYQQQRQAADRSAARTTIRMLESAIRLSQAHARLCFRSSVVVLDACVAISLLEGEMHLHLQPSCQPAITFHTSSSFALSRLREADSNGRRRARHARSCERQRLTAAGGRGCR